MYSEAFCKVYNEFGWNYYPEAFGQELLQWLEVHGVQVRTSLDLACGTGILCEILHGSGIAASGMDLAEGMIDIARKSDAAIHYDVADMITYRPDRRFDLVTCTGDALNHIAELANVERIFRNVYGYLNPGGYFIFDILNEQEAVAIEPFDCDFSETTRARFQITKPQPGTVLLQTQVYENGVLQVEETIRETVHDPSAVCRLLERCGFTVVKCADQLLDNVDRHSTTWYIIAQK